MTDANTTPRKFGTIFSSLTPRHNKTRLTHACESLASVRVMDSYFAGLMDGPHGNTILALQQIISLGELAVIGVLDNLDPPE